MSGMFNLPELTELTFGSRFDTSKVRYMERMFDLPSMESLDISGFDTGSLVFARHMFELPYAKEVNLAGLDLSRLNSREASDRLLNFRYEIVGYFNNTEPGNSAVVLVRGMGSFRGIRAVKFKIKK